MFSQLTILHFLNENGQNDDKTTSAQFFPANFEIRCISKAGAMVRSGTFTVTLKNNDNNTS